jgi:hypothetical protein
MPNVLDRLLGEIGREETRMDRGPTKPAFELNRLAEYTEEAILSELRRVALVVQEGPITASVIAAHGRVGNNTILRRFGTLGSALDAAGLGHRSSSAMKTRGGQIATKLSDDDVLRALRRLAEKLGKYLLTQDDVNRHLPFGPEILRKRWGTLRAAFEAAGLAATKHGRRYSDEECFDNLLAVWSHYGRVPTHKEMSLPPSEVGGKAYMLRFGAWSKALAAFVERVNQYKDPEPGQEPVVPTARVLAPIVEPFSVAKHSAERRDIPLGLRFRVFYRDRFKCVICGDHPARNPECVLHVDHIVPWSLGGKTREDNLRTLCAICNIGRGNRFGD